ncbi:hypothetical protein [Algihabitans albus]|uniref:hypothetical protein n=1 Tax=Algihabitans albus TaxID=2164067 RepID=UPI000E5D3D66|nr:hypothetical protein [Algihabitans albus]
MTKLTRTAAAGVTISPVPLLLAALILTIPPAAAQMYERPFGFAGRDRASLAVIMKQAESGMFDNSGRTSSGSSGLDYNVTNLICGGDSGTANADANSACVILNNSTGNVGADQDAIGDQGASSDVDSTQNNQGDGSLSNALNDLNGGSDSAGGDGDPSSVQ